MFGTKGTPTTPLPLNGIQVAVHMDHEQYSTPQMSFDNSYIKETHEKPRELAMGPDHGVEIDAEK